MKVGLVVDGESEFYGLKPLVDQLRVSTGNEISYPVRANIQPHAPPALIAHACKSRIKQLVLTGCDLIVVMLDREDQAACCPQLARDIQAAISPHCPCSVEVVVKNRTFENWAISDPSALAKQPARFDPVRVKALARKVARDRADSIDALAELKRAVLKGDYDKVGDSVRIMRLATFEDMAANSRSLRRLARLVEHPRYITQSRTA